MNAVNLYVSTTSLVFQADPEDSASWSELFNLVPHLRQSLSCTVCGSLLIEPHTPTESTCQHHVCKSCKGGKKNLKPSCSWCRDYAKYIENVQLRILLQCYKALCEYLASSVIFKRLVCNSSGGPTLAELINEGSSFKDDFKAQGASAKNTYNTYYIPKLYSSISTQTSGKPDSPTPIKNEFSSLTNNSNQIPSANNIQAVIESDSIELPSSLPISHNSVYQVDVVYSQLDANHEQFDKNDTEISVVDIPVIEVPEKLGAALKVQSARRRSRGNSARPAKSLRSASRGLAAVAAPPVVSPPAASIRHGCRCGIATKSALPGKLTCCGQRCPCYIERKACLQCKCRGCRNPHTVDGHKITYPVGSNGLHLNSTTLTTASSPSFEESTLVSASNATVQVVGMCTTPLNVSPNTSGILLDGNSLVTTDHDEDELTLEL